MTLMSTVDARDHFSDVVNRAAFGGERVILTRRGKELAAIVPIEDVRWMEELEDRIDIEEARAALADVREHGTISWEEIKAEHGL
ncbi:MAG: type II toxin-antitoxin system Phd/YefM family antitoxin [Thermomicrobiales bacterium]